MINNRVCDVLNLMDLTQAQHKKVPEKHLTRGVLGGELRRLLIASEIIALPQLIVIAEPALSLELAASLHIFDRLRLLANRGHIVLCACSAPSPQVYSLIDNVVLLSEGFSIFAASKDFIERHFCSPALGYVRRADVEVVDFVLDICSGVERPTNKRVADHPALLQQQFEQSDFFVQSVNTSKQTDGGREEAV
jgi:ABC-type multidrug transport system ATPase subunit